MLVDTERIWYIVYGSLKAALCNFCATGGTKQNYKNNVSQSISYLVVFQFWIE